MATAGFAAATQTKLVATVPAVTERNARNALRECVRTVKRGMARAANVKMGTAQSAGVGKRAHQ
jgi:hypothetical protein